MSHPTLGELTALVMEQAKAKGFGTTPQEINTAEKIALIHSEVCEAYEAYRHNNMNDADGSFAEELGDIIQRVLHLGGIFKIDIEAAILQKLETNKDRVWDWDTLNEQHS